jgi:hypothetical protein
METISGPDVCIAFTHTVNIDEQRTGPTIPDLSARSIMGVTTYASTPSAPGPFRPAFRRSRESRITSGNAAPLNQRRPLYQFNSLITNISTTASRGRANYNALQTSFKQRFRQGLDFQANDTWSRALTNNLGYYGSAGVAAEGAYPMNSYDIEANYGRAFFDARHVFNLAGSYELPFGRERRFGADCPTPFCISGSCLGHMCDPRHQSRVPHVIPAARMGGTTRKDGIARSSSPVRHFPHIAPAVFCANRSPRPSGS